MSPARLLGREPRQFTEYVYEGGVLVGTVTTTEPEFGGRQLALMLAGERVEGDMGSHGQPMSEATSAEADPAVRGGWRYEANDAPRIDWAARAVGLKQDAFYKKFPDVSRAGHLWHARKVVDAV